MVRARCLYCGQSTLQEYCSITCKDSQAAFLAKPFVVVGSLQEAAEYFGRDRRTCARYKDILFSIDKTRARIKRVYASCKNCLAILPISLVRTGFCKNCSKSGFGRVSQASIVSQKYRGAGNPNFTGGATKQTLRHTGPGRRWALEVKERDGACRVCSSKKTLHAHHVLPVALFPGLALDTDNGITMCRFHHIELHRAQLDLLLLPNLYACRSGALPLHEVLANQPQFQELNLLPLKQFDRHELIRVVPRNYRRQLLRLQPEFAQQVLCLYL